MPKISEEHAEARRMQILMGALACFNEKGFHKCTMQDICKSSNLSTGAVYSYFDSKDAIIKALCDFHQRENEQRFHAAIRQGTPRETVNVLIDQFFDLFKDPMHQHMTRADLMMGSEALFNPDVAQTIQRNLDSVRGFLQMIIEGLQKEGAVNREIDSIATANAMMATFQGLSTLTQFDPNIDIDSYKDVLKSWLLGTFWNPKPV